MGKKIFEVYLAKEDVPNNEAYAKLDLPVSPWELWDAMEKVRLNEGEQLCAAANNLKFGKYLRILSKVYIVVCLMFLVAVFL